jgi:hypothetical protein
VDAKNRVNWGSAVYNTNGAIVTSTPATWPWTLSVAAGYDENGNSVGGGNLATGTNADGTYSGSNCNDWMGNSGNYTSGQANSTTSTWISNSTFPCGGSARIYCISN